MQYVLGNMLNGGGINPDGLSLDLQFAADKTLTARRGPTPTFIRSSGDNGGTTYFGPLVDLDTYTEFSTTGITNGRASWFTSEGGTDITISYSGTGWRVVVAYDGVEDVYLAAPGSEWRPDQADWSSQGFTITTSSTFGIVKAANNEPRFDHTSAGVCRGLLIEEGRTNLFLRSEEFDAAYWTEVRASVPTPNTAISPSGSLNADKLVEDASNNTHMVYRVLNTGSLAAHTFSVFAKADGRNFVYLACADGFSANSDAYFNLSNGTLGTIGANATASITAFGNGWYRCSVTATPTSTTSNGFYIQTASANGIISYEGDGASGIFIWGAQLEAGSFPTSYIPTTTGTLARGADVCSITGGDFNNFYNQSEGTLFADVSGLMNTTLIGNRSFFAISDGTYNNYLSIWKASSIASIRGEGVTGGGANQFTLSNPYAPSTQYKVALGVKTNNTNMAANGSLKTTDTSVTLPSTMNRLDLRDPTAAAGGHPSGHIAAIRYFKKRLPDAKLVTLTT
jgi:hypothetical protein